METTTIEIVEIIEDKLLGTRTIYYSDGTYDMQEYVAGLGWLD